MVRESQSNSEWISLVEKLPTASGLHASTRTPVSGADIDNKFALLKAEAARTLAIIDNFRASPLHRLSSFDPR